MDMPREEVNSSFEATLHVVNNTLESHERLSTLFVVHDPWTIENELLTPTMKLKRDDIEARYADVITNPGETITWV